MQLTARDDHQDSTDNDETDRSPRGGRHLSVLSLTVSGVGALSPGGSRVEGDGRHVRLSATSGPTTPSPEQRGRPRRGAEWVSPRSDTRHPPMEPKLASLLAVPGARGCLQVETRVAGGR